MFGKNMFRRFFLVGILIFAMLVSGCNSKKSSKTAPNINDSQSNTQTNTTINYQILPVPEEGWTGEEVATTLYINGHQFTYPFSIESLGENYTLNETESNLLDNGLCGVKLNYNGDFVDFLSLNYSNIQSLEEVNDKTPNGINVNFSGSSLSSEDIIVFNNIRIGSTLPTKEEIEKSFGVAPKGDTNTLFYPDKNRTDKNCLGFWFDDNGQLTAFSIIF
jgi:hypothetical protein